MLFTGPWRLKDLAKVPKNNCKVFSAFHCGGGSTMGYKLAGFTVLGGVEIDPKMVSVYRKNHTPAHSFLMGVREFNQVSLEKLPKELLKLDILDGSPPCSSFSMAGSREKDWGKKKKFKEGQAAQVLDDLFFDFIWTVKKLQPKIAIAENVKGLIAGNAKGYVKLIAEQFDKAGYDLQLFLLNAAFMGVPQRRERVFFVARKKELKLPCLVLDFNETPIPVAKVAQGIPVIGRPLKPYLLGHWKGSMKNGRSKGKTGNTFGYFYKVNPSVPCATIQAGGDLGHWEKPHTISKELVTRLQSFPDDFDFCEFDAQYICGMSVPPFMMQRIAHQVYMQWLAPRKPAKQDRKQEARA